MAATSRRFYLFLYRCQQQIFFRDDPRSEFHDLPGRKNALSDKPLYYGVTHLQFSRRLLLRYPVILLLEGRDLVISP